MNLYLCFPQYFLSLVTFGTGVRYIHVMLLSIWEFVEISTGKERSYLFYGHKLNYFHMCTV